MSEGYAVVGFFYGGNIHPEEEYVKRMEAVLKLGRSVGIDAVISRYDPESWIDIAGVFADEPEGGKRCAICFGLQLEAAAAYAENQGFTHLSTTLTISPHKDPILINSIGKEAAGRHGLLWVEKIWRKKDGFKRSVEESNRLGLYRQDYCGCIYSIR